MERKCDKCDCELGVIEKRLVESLAPLRRALRAAGFDDDQAFDLCREYARQSRYGH